MKECACAAARHDTKLVVLAGGPGAGKTAVLEVVRQHFCADLAVAADDEDLLSVRHL